MERTAIYRTVWRWHFYAGVLVLPLMIVLSLSGALYLFKPQVERWEERAFHGLPTDHAVAPSAQLAAAMAAFPEARFASYRLPERTGDAAMVHLALPQGQGMRDVFVSPQGKVLGVLDPDQRIIAIDREIHGQLLLGRSGSWLVELAASWAIVMIATGLYMWWPRDRGLAGVVWPRLGRGSRTLWRDLHAVTGFWVSGLALVLLFTGLPWADAWGSAFKAVRQEAGWIKGTQDWTIGGRSADAGGLHAEHDHTAMMAAMPAASMTDRTPPDPALFDTMVGHAEAADLAFPALVIPPGAPAGEGGSGRPSPNWVVKSDAQNRPLRVTIRYDAQSGRLLSREDFGERQIIDRIIGYGVAWHEGQLFGWINQLIGLMTAVMLITITVSGFVMWRRRKPAGELGAPPAPANVRLPGGWGFRVLVLFLIVWLPLFAASAAVLWLLDRFVLVRLPGIARWLGRPALGKTAT